MSLGLGDLNKKRRPTDHSSKTQKAKSNEKKSTAVDSIPKIVSGPTAQAKSTRRVRSRTARPWSQSGIVHGANNRGRRRNIATDATMNEEWVSVHAEPLFWVDLSQHSRLACLQTKLTRLEEQIQHTIRRPWQIIQRLCL